VLRWVSQGLFCGLWCPTCGGVCVCVCGIAGTMTARNTLHDLRLMQVPLPNLALRKKPLQASHTVSASARGGGTLGARPRSIGGA
jgi:hypothetical protein